MIPILVITLYTYQRYTALIDEQTAQVAENVFYKAVEQLETAIDQVNHVHQMITIYSTSTVASIIDDIQKYASAKAEYSDYDVFLSNQRIQFVAQSLMLYTEDLNGIFLFTPSGPVIGYGYNSGIDIMPMYDPRGDKWYENTLALHGGTCVDGVTTKDFIINARPSITFTKAIYDVYTKKFLGVLMVDCKPEIFDLSKSNALPDTVMLTVQNEETVYVLYTNVADVPERRPAQDLRISKGTLSLESISITAAVDYKRLNRNFGHTRMMLVVIAATCALILLLLSEFFSRALTRPITYLSVRMANRSGNNFVTNSQYLRRADEVGVMYNEYNNLLEELDRSVKSNYQNKLIAMDSQMKSLEAQINSHFLYNTLESINSLAEIEGLKSIATMSMALGNMFRYSIKTESELVTIEEELNHVQDYISIQKIRFNNKFSLVVDISLEVKSLLVLKLILQPLVENALLHGLQRCSAGGEIRISGGIEDDFIVLHVADDGIGMGEEQLRELQITLEQEPQFSELGHRNTQSIGLKNIHSRIELYYGRGCGLSIATRASEGTCISIRLPMQSLDSQQL
jgi:two-component system sensor histidine kinase YesM